MVKVPFIDMQAPYAELRSELDAATRRVMESGHYILSEEVPRFESEFAKYCGAKHCIGVGNGLDALHLILRGYDIGPGDEVIVPAHTFIATWLAVALTGAVPVPVEPEAGGFLIDLARIDAAITKKTRAIMPVHLYGEPCDMTPLAASAKRHKLKLIEDAAQAHGAEIGGKKAGALGDAAGFSFYPAKNLGAFGDAGAIVTNDDALAEKLRLLRNYGSKVKYQHEIKGVNSRLDPVQAAALGVKLKHLDAWNERRRAIAERYLAAFKDHPAITLPPKTTGKHVWHLFVVRTAQRDRLKEALAKSGVETLIHYPVPPHLSGAFKGDFKAGSLPIAELLANEVLSLPMGPHMTDEQVERVIDAVKQTGKW